jgi:tetratricopeptide (TPR) repeat protein
MTATNIARALLLGALLLIPGCGTTTVCGTADPSDAARMNSCTAAIESGNSSGSDLAELYNNRGAYHIRFKQYGAAVADLTSALDIEPDRTDYLTNRAVAYRRLGKYDLAYADLDHAHRIDPNDQNTYWERTLIDLDRRDYESALKDTHSATAVGAPNYHHAMVLAYLYERHGDLDNAIAVYTSVVSQGGIWKILAVFRGNAYLEAGKQELADADFAEAASANGDYAYASALRCYARTRLATELALAALDCDRAVAARPDERYVHDIRAFLLFTSGRYGDAIEEYSVSMRLDPAWKASQFGRGMARRKSGDMKGGDADLAAARADDPDVEKEYERVIELERPPTGVSVATAFDQ